VSNIQNPKIDVGAIVDEDFDVADGIHSTLRDVIPEFNFGVIDVLPTGHGATLHGALAHAGNAFAVGLDIADLL
jgi:hypothetical protein